ncbi:hypothetical protein Hdeb2414_s0015g00444081 [Helianthus debilis subsp. tardiflorus]
MINRYTNFTFTDGREMILNDQITISLTRLISVDTSINIALTRSHGSSSKLWNHTPSSIFHGP